MENGRSCPVASAVFLWVRPAWREPGGEASTVFDVQPFGHKHFGCELPSGSSLRVEDSAEWLRRSATPRCKAGLVPRVQFQIAHLNRSDVYFAAQVTSPVHAAGKHDFYAHSF